MIKNDKKSKHYIYDQSYLLNQYLRGRKLVLCQIE